MLSVSSGYPYSRTHVYRILGVSYSVLFNVKDLPYSSIILSFASRLSNLPLKTTYHSVLLKHSILLVSIPPSFKPLKMTLQRTAWPSTVASAGSPSRFKTNERGRAITHCILAVSKPTRQERAVRLSGPRVGSWETSPSGPGLGLGSFPLTHLPIRWFGLLPPRGHPRTFKTQEEQKQSPGYQLDHSPGYIPCRAASNV